MKKLICLLLFIPFIFSGCSKDEPIEPEPAYYKTYIMASDYVIYYSSNYKYVPNLTGSVEYKKNSLTLKILENGNVYVSKIYKITEVYDKKFDATFLYEGTNVIGMFMEKGHSGATKDTVYLSQDLIKNSAGQNIYLRSDFY